MQTPYVIVVGGPNGAGKSTTAPVLLRDTLGVSEFVNADTIAQGLSGFRPNAAAMEAGRLMLRRIKRLAAQRRTFAFETTLASRSFAPWLRTLKMETYNVAVMFFWLPSPDHAVARVRLRVSRGGHDVPEAIVRRRYRAGISNFLRIYAPLVDAWWLYDNEIVASPRLLARKSRSAGVEIIEPNSWQAVQVSAND